VHPAGAFLSLFVCPLDALPVSYADNHLIFSENDNLAVSEGSVHTDLRSKECPGTQTQVLNHIVVFV
jgi:hypothetical protein